MTAGVLTLAFLFCGFCCYWMGHSDGRREALAEPTDEQFARALIEQHERDRRPREADVLPFIRPGA